MTELPRADEIEWLRYFISYADFGPADDDVRHAMAENFRRKTGKGMPVGWKCYDEEPEDE